MNSTNSWIKLNVGGRKFETTHDTIQKSEYLKDLVSKSTEDEYKIDRSGEIFEHVLCLLRNENYLYPEEYCDELDFYLISINPILKTSNNSLAKQLKKINEKLAKLEKKTGSRLSSD